MAVSAVQAQPSPNDPETSSLVVSSSSDHDTVPTTPSATSMNVVASTPMPGDEHIPPRSAPLFRVRSDPVVPPPIQPTKTAPWLQKRFLLGEQRQDAPAEHLERELDACGWLREEPDSSTDAETAGQVEPEFGGGDSDGDSSTSDFVCQTAASIERAWAAVQRAKQHRPSCIRWWSY
ncbi:hypothetical protein JCM3774_006407 [Rhodotorula dairenensis]